LRSDYGILDGDFFLADMFAEDNTTILKNLAIILEKNVYKINQIPLENKTAPLFAKDIIFNDYQRKHKRF